MDLTSKAPGAVHRCKYCSDGIDNLSPHQRSNHMRWCLSNPKNVEYRTALVKARAAIPVHHNQWSNIDWSIVPWERLSWNRKKQRVLLEANYACEYCRFNEPRIVPGSSAKTILQVNHRDGNKRNCTRENLEAMCPNCHALHSEHFMFYGRKHTGDMSRFNTSKSRHGVTDNMQTSEV